MTDHSYSEGEPLSTDPIQIATEPEHARYIPGSGYGIAVFSVPSLPGYWAVYLVNEEDERLKHLVTRALKSDAVRDIATRSILTEARLFEAEQETKRKRVVFNCLISVYGNSAFVMGVAEHLVPMILELFDERTWDDSPEARNAIRNLLWANWPGGGTADIAADKIMATLRTQE